MRMTRIGLCFLLFILAGCNKDEVVHKVSVSHDQYQNQMKDANEELEKLMTAEHEQTFNGLDVFNRTCTACHEKIEVVSVNLPQGASNDQVIAIISDGYGNMPPFRSILKEAEIKAVAEEIIKTTSQQ